MQLAASLLPALESEFAGQSRHVDADVAAASSLYVPAGHSWHADADVAAAALLYVPAGHSWHATDTFTSL